MDYVAIIGIFTASVMSLILAFAFWMFCMRKKKSNQLKDSDKGRFLWYTYDDVYNMHSNRLYFVVLLMNLHVESHEENDRLDGIEPDVIEEYAEVYGDINEDPDVRYVVNNPYYGVDIKMETSRCKTSRGNKESKEVEVIKSTKNVYYNM